MQHIINPKFQKKSLAYQIGMLSLATSLLGGGATVHAQVLEEVTVTAQKRAQSTQDIGIAITAFSGDDTRELKMETPANLGAHTPGLSTANAQSGAVPVFSIRGIGLDDYNVNNSSSVGVYIDQVFASSPAFVGMQLMDIGSVEVLKGPQGTLYGKSATGGAIKFKSNRPTEELEARLTASYDRFDEIRVDGFVSGALSESVRGRLSAMTVQGGEYQDDVYTGEEYGDKDIYNLRGLLDIDIGEDASLLLNVHGGRDESNYATTVIESDAAGLVEFGLEGGTVDDGFLGPRDVEASFKPFVDNEGWGASAIFDVSLSFADFTSITAYDEYQFRNWDNYDGRASVYGDVVNDIDLDQVSQEFRLVSNSDGDFSWIAGLSYSKESSDGNAGVLVGDTYSLVSVFDDPAFGGPGWYTDVTGNAPVANPDALSTLADTAYDQEIESFGAYLHTETQLGERWRLTLAARYSHDEVEYEADVLDFTAFPDAQNPGAFIAGSDAIWLLAGTPTNVLSDGVPVRTGGVGGPGEDPGDENDDNISGKIALDYFVNDDVLLYASVATGYKNGRYYSGPVPFASYLFYVDPEELTAYEVGFKSTLLDGSLQLNGAAYYYDFEDRQSMILDEFNAVMLANIPESEVTGGELDLWWLPLEGLDIKAGVAYMDAQVEEGPSSSDLNGNIPAGNVENGTVLSQSPEWSYNAMVRYGWDVSASLSMVAMLDYSYKDEQIASVSDPGSVYGSTQALGGRLALASNDGSWEVALWGRNLTDEDDANFAQTTFAGEPMRMLQKPRTYGVEFTYHWY